MPAFSILVGEDDVVLRNLYRKKFTMKGYDFREAADGEEVIRKVAEKTPDVLILDVRMPKKDGMDVLRELPKYKRSFPIIILTNFHNTATAEKSKELGADQYISKRDTTMKSLLQTVESILPARA